MIGSAYMSNERYLWVGVGDKSTGTLLPLTLLYMHMVKSIEGDVDGDWRWFVRQLATEHHGGDRL